MKGKRPRSWMNGRMTVGEKDGDGEKSGELEDGEMGGKKDDGMEEMKDENVQKEKLVRWKLERTAS